MTPGPWDVLIDRDGRCDGIVARASWNPELEYYEDYIVQTDSGVYGPTLPDAYAIAAVPEMLAALEQISTDIAQSILEQPLETRDDRFFVGLDSRAKMQAAIRKARGRT